MYIREKIENQIKALIAGSVDAAMEAGDFSVEALPEIYLEVPREKEHGDYATNIAMQLPKQAHKAPRVIAESIVRHMDIDNSYVEAVEIAGPGFINFKLKSDWVYEVLLEIEAMQENYGKTQGNAGKNTTLSLYLPTPQAQCTWGTPAAAPSGIFWPPSRSGRAMM